MKPRSAIRSRKRSAPIHKYTFALWPPDSLDRSYPIQLPEHVSVLSVNPHDALKAAAAMAPLGWMITPACHVRSQCDPPHPGQKP